MTTDTRTGGRQATRGVVEGRIALSVGMPGLPQPTGYAWRPLSQVARLESGHTPSRSRAEYWDGDIPWIGIRDATVNHGTTITSTNQSITQEGLDNSSARLLPAGTVCLSRTASVGYVVQMGVPMATSQDFVNWVCGPELSPEYLKYILVLEQESVRRFAHGTTHQTMYYPEAKALHALLPSRGVQDAVVEVLGALDDKIAANATLTKTAVALADAAFARASRGLAFGPQTFEELASVQGGGTPSTKIDEYWGEDVMWATPTDVTNLGAPYLEATARRISYLGLGACSSALHSKGSILMTSRATIGAFAVAQTDTAVNQGFIVVNANDPSLQWWLFHEMRSRVPEFLSHANGATFLELSRGRFKKLPVRLPADGEMFGRAVAPLHARARAAAVESQRLADMRDALLPQLMSGKITVKDAERVVEGAV